MTFDLERAKKLWCDVYSRGLDGWDCRNEVVRIAAMCGLGVLSIEAKNFAVETIRNDYREGSRYSRKRYEQLTPTIYRDRWAQLLSIATMKFPTPAYLYPIECPSGHVVGEIPCFGQARKGTWTDACYRAAWGNTEPFGLEFAEKPCPHCLRPMQYWCWGKEGATAFRWTIDHVISHARGGCVCHFNLRAMHPECNSSKG